MKPKHPRSSSSLKGSFGAREQNPREGGAEVEGESLWVHSLSHRWDAWGRMLRGERRVSGPSLTVLIWVQPRPGPERHLWGCGESPVDPVCPPQTPARSEGEAQHTPCKAGAGFHQPAPLGVTAGGPPQPFPVPVAMSRVSIPARRVRRRRRWGVLSARPGLPLLTPAPGEGKGRSPLPPPHRSI